MQRCPFNRSTMKSTKPVSSFIIIGVFTFVLGFAYRMTSAEAPEDAWLIYDGPNPPDSYRDADGNLWMPCQAHEPDQPNRWYYVPKTLYDDVVWIREQSPIFRVTRFSAIIGGRTWILECDASRVLVVP